MLYVTANVAHLQPIFIAFGDSLALTNSVLLLHSKTPLLCYLWSFLAYLYLELCKEICFMWCGWVVPGISKHGVLQRVSSAIRAPLCCQKFSRGTCFVWFYTLLNQHFNQLLPCLSFWGTFGCKHSDGFKYFHSNCWNPGHPSGCPRWLELLPGGSETLARSQRHLRLWF